MVIDEDIKRRCQDKTEKAKGSVVSHVLLTLLLSSGNTLAKHLQHNGNIYPEFGQRVVQVGCSSVLGQAGSPAINHRATKPAT